MWQISGHYSSTGIIPLVAEAHLLDTYTGALVAYSFRKLRGAYAGSAVRIRRSSDDAEADIGFSGNDFNAAAAAAHIGGGTGYIVTWYDQSGNGDNVTQAIAAAQPTYSATGINSLPSITQTGGSLYLTTATDTVSLGGSVASGFAVGALNSALTASFGRLLTILGTGDTLDYADSGSGCFILRDSGNQGVCGYRIAAQKSIKAIVYDQAHQITSIYDSTNHIIYVDQSAGTTVASSGTFGATVTVRVGAGLEGTLAPWGGAYGEVILWGSDQTSNLAGIANNQKAYWGTA